MFDALCAVIEQLSNKKFYNFRPVLDAYIQKHFSGAKAHKTLIQCLKFRVNQMSPTVLKTLKALEYLFKFMIQSRMLHKRQASCASDQEFKDELSSLFRDINNMMSCSDDAMVGAKVVALQNFGTVFDDTSKVFTMKELSCIARDFLNSVSRERRKAYTENKFAYIGQLVQGYLFTAKEGRVYLLPAVLEILRDYIVFEGNEQGAASPQRGMPQTPASPPNPQQQQQQQQQQQEDLGRALETLGDILSKLRKDKKLYDRENADDYDDVFFVSAPSLSLCINAYVNVVCLFIYMVCVYVCVYVCVCVCVFVCVCALPLVHVLSISWSFPPN